MSRHSLQPGYQLHWYVIREILGQGGFGITYLADDTNLNQRVAIKEYLPTELAIREDDDSVHPVSGEHGEQFEWGLERFIQEARTLAQFKHNNIVRVLTVFTDNNTAYMVMEYEEGHALHDMLKERKTLPEAEQLQILIPLLDGLEKVHAMGFIHRDIKPANIYLRSDGSPVLLDFGSARQALGHHTRTLTTMVSPGYAPFEQYVSKSDKQGPWTDIYGLGATLYRATVGQAPPNAVDRSEAILHTERDLLVSCMEINPAGYSQPFLQAIDHALYFKADDRPQTIGDWRRDFSGILAEPEAVTTPAADFVNIAPESEQQAPTFTIDTVQSNAATAATGPAPFQPSFADRLYNWLKNFVKWGAILLGVLILLSLCEDKASKEGPVEPEITVTPEITESPQTDQAPPDPSAEVQEEVPATEPATTEDRIGALLDAAEDDVRALRLTSPAGNNAVEKYHQVLQLDPFNGEARAGLTKVADKYLELMDGALDKSEISRARRYLAKAGEVDPLHPGLAEARYKLQSAMAEEQARQEAAKTVREKDVSPVEPARDSRRSEQPGLMSEQERNTLERIKEQLAKNPDDKVAQRQAKRLAKNFERKVKKALEEGEFDLAESYVREAIEIAPENEGLWDALRKIQEIRIKTGR